MTVTDIELSSRNLDAGIEALSRVTEKFQLTRLELFAYNGLMISVDAMSLGFLSALIAFQVALFERTRDVLGIIVGLSFLSAVFFVFLNIPLSIKISNELHKLRKLGLASLSKSLWKENQRNQWFSMVRIRKVILVIFASLIFIRGYYLVRDLMNALGQTNALGQINEAARAAIWYQLLVVTPPLIIIILVLSMTRYITNQRERIELASSATKLKRTLENLRMRAGQAETVSVPSILVDQAAKIETATIARERDEAVVKSVASRPSGYAIRFARDAADKRTKLSVTERVEFEDIVTRLSAGGPLNPEESHEAHVDGTAETESGGHGLMVQYALDEPTRSILITGIRHADDGWEARDA